MPGVFISYRRSDARGTTGRLYDVLKQRLHPVQVFRDIYNLKPGVKYDEAIQQALASSDVLLAVIGPGWLKASDTNGRRLDDPTDLLRREIVTALAWNIPVIPVLVDNATMPSRKDLPPDLQPLSGLQSIKLSDDHWDQDTERLLKELAAILKIRLGTTVQRRPGADPDAGRNGNGSRGFAAGATGLIMFLVILGVGGTLFVRILLPIIQDFFNDLDLDRTEATIALSRSSGPAGTALTIDGSGFEGGEMVVIRFHAQEVGRIRAEEDGTFNDVQVQVPSDWGFTGQFHFSATGNSSIKTADMPFQVT